MAGQAITTKFLGPTNHRGARIKAMAWAGSITVDYRHELNQRENHARAAQTLARKFEWHGEWIGGGSHDQAGFVFVNQETVFEAKFSA